MRFVVVDPVIDPGPYLAELSRLESELPPGAYDFASDPGHYDFYGSRCVKDLTVGTLTLSDAGELNVETRFEPNEWKHDASLRITYEQVSSLNIATSDKAPVGPTRLGSLILDELLPHDDGVSHEIVFHGGTLTIVCRDLKAAWAPAG